MKNPALSKKIPKDRRQSQAVLQARINKNIERRKAKNRYAAFSKLIELIPTLNDAAVQFDVSQIVFELKQAILPNSAPFNETEKLIDQYNSDASASCWIEILQEQPLEFRVLLLSDFHLEFDRKISLNTKE